MRFAQAVTVGEGGQEVRPTPARSTFRVTNEKPDGLISRKKTLTQSHDVFVHSKEAFEKYKTMPLKLSLKPGETFVVNGAVLRNGERRGVLLLENHARVLREKDIMQPEEADTPVRQAYFAVMQMYLTGETEGPAYDRTALALAGVLKSQPDDALRQRILDISRDVSAGALYRALTGCRKLITARREMADA